MASELAGESSELGKLPSGWVSSKLGDICDIKGRIGWRGYTVDDLRDSGPLVIGATQISNDNRLDLSKPTYISREKFEESPEIKIDQWDILVVKVGNTIGKVALIRNKIGDACINPNAVLLKRARVDSRFLFYHLTGTYAQHFLRANSVASAQPAINQTVLKSLVVPVPPPEEQCVIAHILGTLDDKIELNRRMNETLEAIARAIFKSWFVNFDPVRAKASGEPPESICCRLGLTPDILALFPDRLINSALGEIPERWTAGTIADHCYLNAQSWTDRTLPAVVYYVDLANAKSGIVSQVQVFSSSNAPSRARRVLRVGDTIVGTVRPGNRSFALIGEDSAQLTGSTGFAVLTPKRAELREIVYFLATSDENISRLSHLADGAAYPAVRPDVVISGGCVVPTTAVSDAFHSIVSPMIDRQIANQANDTTLAIIRDSILPKLLSGELRISLEGVA